MAGASCDNLIGLEDWEDPPSQTDGSGGGGAPPGSGGAAGSGGDAATGGGGGAGGSTGAGIMGEQEGGPECDTCLVNCASQIKACEDDPDCNAKYRPCLFEPSACCKANGKQWFGPLAQAAHACIVEKCSISCSGVNPHCGDCLVNAAETDVDCGGDVCNPCASGQKCDWDYDCKSATCTASDTCM